MVVPIASQGPIHLLALGLSKQASTQVQKMRQALWQASGDISFLSLPPLIPLLWSNTGFTPFEQVKLPHLPSTLTFSHLTEKKSNLFLTTEDKNGLTTLTHIGAQYSTIFPTQIPFPSFPGIYLGSSRSLDEPPFLPIVINDWRLLYLQIEWRRDATQLIALRYSIISDRHLLTI